MGEALEEVARNWHKSNSTCSAHHASRILRNLEIYLFPYPGKQAIQEITTAVLIAVLKNVEERGFLEVALRLEQRLVSIMRYAVQNQIIKYNPAGRAV